MAATVQQITGARVELVDDPWYADHQNLALLWRWLEDRGDQPADPAHFIEKPWKWEPEWNELQAEQAHEERLATDPDYAAEVRYRNAGGRDPQGPAC